ncbi:hypothetical protein KR054_004134 [Drosophila jambulina]|nr:hypothetical protein KR054_004134 [Drosophila jambulina]
MFNFGTYLLWALGVFTLLRGSLAGDRQSSFVCLVEDTDPNRCDIFCLTELRPLLKQVIKGQGRGVTCDADNETKEKLDRLVGQEARLASQFQGVEVKMEGRLQEVQTKLEAKLEGQQAVLTRMAESLAKLEGNLLAVQTSLESTLQAVLNQLQAVSKQIDVAKEETAELVSKEIQKIPPGFERIGSRYFKIVEEEVDWITAERKCREMGSYLASFQSEEEINAITEKLKWGLWSYWLGLNDRDSEGRFLSVASNKPAQFLKWFEGEPNNYNNNQNCVVLFEGKMWDFSCNEKYYFICQSDNET